MLSSIITFKKLKLPLTGLIFTFYLIYVVFRGNLNNSFNFASEINRNLFGLMCLLTGFYFKESIKKISYYIMAGGFLSSIYGLLQKTGGVYIIQVPRMDRIMSFSGNPIFFAALLLFSIPVTYSLLLSSPRKTPFFIILAVEVLALYHTQTRAAYLAIVATAIVATISSRTGKKLSVLLSLLAFSVVFILLKQDVLKRDIEKIKTAGHILIWEGSFKMFKENFIFGCGADNFVSTFPDYASEELKSKWPPGRMIVNHAHNEYLELLSTLGITGGVLFFIFIFYLLRHGPQNTIQSGFYYSIAAILIQNFFSVDFRFTVSFGFFMLYAGFISNRFFNIKYTFLPAIGILLYGARVLYVAAQQMKETPDFFETKLIDSITHIQELENLLKIREDARIYERLGFLYAKEIGDLKNPKREFVKKSINAYENAVRLNPELYSAWNNLGNLYFYFKGDVNGAIKCYKNALEVKPDFVEAHLNLGKIYYLRGELKKSAERFDWVIKNSKDASKVLEAMQYKRKMVE